MISNIHEISNGNLQYQPHDDFEHNRLVHSLSGILININTELKTDWYNFDIVVKLYEDFGHGESGEERYIWIPATSIVDLACIQENMQTYFPASANNIVCALSGIVRMQNKPEQIYFFPAIDLEVDKTDEGSFNNMVQTLIDAKLTGFIMESGFSYHYFADFAMNYERNYWQFLGYALKNLIDKRDTSDEALENSYKAKILGSKLMDAKDYLEVQSIAEKIHQTFESLPTGKTRAGILLDPRWLGYKIRNTELGITVNTLRVTSGKGHPFPVIKGGIY